MDRARDPMGRAIAEYYETGKADRLRVLSPMFEEDEIPLATLFRDRPSMPEIERTALDMARGRVLDVGAGAGCHTLALQEQGLDVTAIDVSPLSVETMKRRGVKQAFEQDFFELGTRQSALPPERQYDTILMLMNGIGLVGTLKRMPKLFKLFDKILAPGGQVLCDSSDISYVFDTGDGTLELPEDMEYYGQQSFLMQYKDAIGDPFDWLYINAETLRQAAGKQSYAVEVVAEGTHYDYLARLTRGLPAGDDAKLSAGPSLAKARGEFL